MSTRADFRSLKPLAPNLAKVRDAYDAAYTRHCVRMGTPLSKPHRSSPSHNCHWATLDRMIKQSGVSPEVYFSVVFRSMQPGEKSYPNILASSRRAWDFGKARGMLTEQLKKELDSDRAEMRRVVTLRIVEESEDELTAAKTALLDPESSLSAIFRYCFAAYYDVRGVKSVFKTQAVAEYRALRPLYDDAWGSFIAISLRRCVDQEAGCPNP